MADGNVDETVARYMAAEDWLEDRADDAWWSSCLPEFREQYLTSAREVIGIVRAAARLRHPAACAAAGQGRPQLHVLYRPRSPQPDQEVPAP